MAGARQWVDPTDTAYILVRLAFDWADEAIDAALKLNNLIEVIEPDHLRRAIVDSALAILARYDGGSATERRDRAP